MSDENIVDVFVECCERGLIEQGVPNRCVWENEGGDKINVGILEIPPDDVIRFAMNCLLCKGAKEIVFGLDRLVRNKDAQGVETNDLVSVFHFDHNGWHYGILQYCYDPRIWREIAWNNAYWNHLMQEEVIRYFETAFLKMRGKVDEDEKEA